MTIVDEEASSSSSGQVEQNRNKERLFYSSTWCNGLKFEAQMPDTFTLKDINGRDIDAIESFAPTPIIRTRTLRFLLLFGNISCWIWDIIDDQARDHYFIFLTRWSLLLSHLYLFLSLMISFYPNKILRHHSNNSTINEDNEMSCNLEVVQNVTKIYWELAALLIPVNMVVVFMYWGVDAVNNEWDDVTYLQVWVHGLILVSILFDTLLIGRIPIRVKQYRSVLLFSLLYFFWTIVHSLLQIGNHYHNNWDGSEDDDVIYEIISWKKRPGSAIGFAVFTIFMLLPLFFLLAREVSLRHRRYK